VHSGRALALDAPGHDDIANIGFVVGSRCVAVIDSGGSVRVGRALRAAINARTRVPVCYVINTHVHVDHVLGNAALRGDHVEFVGHARLAEALARSREFFLKNYAEDLDPPASAEQIVAPDRTVKPGSDLELDLGERRLVLRAWPKAHTDCDLTVFDVTTGTLWTGDLVFVGRTPALDGSLSGWLAVLAELSQQHPAHVVPGHGAVGTDLAGALAPELRYLEALEQQVRAQLAAGKPLETALKEVTGADRQHWLLWDTTHPRNVARAYQELEWE
jgi:quinoprotein relay system zinc metallohydrolase 2